MTGSLLLDLGLALDEIAWMDDAACRGLDPDLFFPQRGEDSRQAKAICAACPVAGDCLDFALTNTEKHGVWGGLSERERRRIRTRRRQGWAS